MHVMHDEFIASKLRPKPGILDNLRVHRAKTFTAWVEANKDKIELFYQPPPAFVRAGSMPPSAPRTTSSTTP